ncbi:MAG TPA: uroporphyrinogen decarboxylase family protein [Victivallales bacterium]|nr:uroporphyrinogen decarboxylase family protein [Victivallales bacterium]
MPMTSRERMLTALNNEKPDRLPCQVHGWMNYYLKNYLGGMDEWQAFEKFGMDYAIYVSPRYLYNEKDLANWNEKHIILGTDSSGNKKERIEITTPKGCLSKQIVHTDVTDYDSEHLIKDIADFEIWNEYCPVPSGIDFTPILNAKDRLGDKGIIRSHPFSPGQGSPWQSFCTLYGTETSIFLGMDEPDTLHHILESIVQKTLRVTEMWHGTPADMVEVGGGAGSNTVISPNFYREFGLPYDQRQNKLLHEAGLKVVNHFCGGLMAMLDIVVESNADGLETMTPPNMGGDCDLHTASQKVGDKLFFIGGFDQNAGFEHGTPKYVRKLVFDCFEATKDHGGYIICPSDHFFHGDPANIQAFVDAAKECVY